MHRWKHNLFDHSYYTWNASMRWLKFSAQVFGSIEVPCYLKLLCSFARIIWCVVAKLSTTMVVACDFQAWVQLTYWPFDLDLTNIFQACSWVFIRRAKSNNTAHKHLSNIIYIRNWLPTSNHVAVNSIFFK